MLVSKNRRVTELFKKLISKFALILVIGLMILNLTTPVFAAEKNQLPFESYSYWNNYAGTENKKAVNNRPIYKVRNSIDYISMGLPDQLKQITDIFCDEEGFTYILDGGKSQIIILDKEYSLVNNIKELNNENNKISFLGAKGLYVDINGEIYIADTDNKRILVCDKNGNYIETLYLPKSKLIPESFNYKPIKLVKDSKDYLYVLSDGSYYGAILYSPDGDFLGFYGANSVKKSIGEALSTLFNKLLINNDKRAKLETTLPFQFTDLCADKKDFIYTATGNTSTKNTDIQTGQIRKLSPGGSDVLDSDSINYGDSEISVKSQDILGIDVDDNGFLYALDSTYGHIFVYDQNNNNLGVFGSGSREGIQNGSFTDAIAIAVNGDDVLVADGTLNTVSIFECTEYGTKLKEAQTLVNDGDYNGAMPLWKELYRLDKQNQLVYIGLAKSYYEQGDYEKAMDFAKRGYDKETYALAFTIIRNDFITNNFTLIVVVTMLLIVIIVLLIKYLKKKITIHQKIKTAISVLTHPADTFAQMKLKGGGSYIIAVIIMFLYYITNIISTKYKGFCYATSDPTSINAFLILLRSVGIVVLFSLCYWAVSTVMHGLGKIGEIFICVCYSFQPLIIANLIYVVLTNVMLPSEIAFLDLFMTIMMGYTAFILCIGLMKISDYEFGKFVGVSVLTVAGIVIVLFIGTVVFLLLQLLWNFFITVFQETYKVITFGG